VKCCFSGTKRLPRFVIDWDDALDLGATKARMATINKFPFHQDLRKKLDVKARTGRTAITGQGGQLTH
jgi:hypothetical protein